jgi:hypothetical protein
MARDKGSRAAITNPFKKKKKAAVPTNGKAIRPLSAEIDMSTMDKICRISLLQEALADAAEHIRVSLSAKSCRVPLML